MIDGSGFPAYGSSDMRPSLPFATHQSQHRGLLMDGQISHAWGNRIGTNMSIGLAFSPAGTGDEQSGGGGGGDSVNR
jgi:hypothetical protein